MRNRIKSSHQHFEQKETKGSHSQLIHACFYLMKQCDVFLPGGFVLSFLVGEREGDGGLLASSGAVGGARAVWSFF